MSTILTQQEVDAYTDVFPRIWFLLLPNVHHAHAVLRRGAEKAWLARTIEVADLRIEPASRQAWRAGNLLELTKCEYDLLELLARHVGQVLTTGTIFQCVWGDNHDIGQEIVKVYIHALRKKLNRDGQANLIETRRGVGYMLCRNSLPLDKRLM